MEKIKELLERLSKALEDFDIEEANTVFEELKNYSLSDDIKQSIVSANEHLEEFEYDKAGEIINELLKD